MAIKLTWFFESYQQAGPVGQGAAVGWTETWYLGTETNLDTALAIGSSRVMPGSYLGHRLSVLPSIYRCSFLRASVEPVGINVERRPIAKVLNIVNASGQIQIEHNVNPVGQVQCAILVDFVRLPIGPADPFTHHRRWLMRALPSEFIDGNVLRTTGDNYVRFRAFMDFLGATSRPIGPGVQRPANPIYSLRFINATSLSLPISVLTVLADNPRRIQITSPGVGAVGLGGLVRIKRVSFPRGINRNWRVVSTSGNPDVATLGTSRFDLAGTWAGDGIASALNYDYAPPSQYTVIGLRVKKTGRPSRLLRGRRSVS